MRSALEPLAKKTGTDDHRLLEKRYADALVELRRQQDALDAAVARLIGRASCRERVLLGV